MAKCQIAKARENKINVSKKHVAKYVCLRGRGEEAGFNVIEYTYNRRSNEKRRKERKSTFFEVTSDPSNPPLRSVGFLFSFDYYIISPLSRLCKKFARVPTELFCNCLAHGERPLQHESSLGKPEAKPDITERS